MRKLNKQDLIFIGKVLLYIIVTFRIYLLARQHFIIDNCIPTLGGVPGYICFGYLHFFDKVSIYFYTLFLWITIVPYMRRKYLFPNNTIYATGIAVLVLLMIYICRITPMVFLDNSSTGKQVTPLENLGTGATWFSHK